jgi:GNAT superfamily N-acetyltransferase
MHSRDARDHDMPIRAENRRRYPALLLHYAMRPLGYMEFTDVYSIDPKRAPEQRALQGYDLGYATDAEIECICRILVRDEPPNVIRKLRADGHHCFVARHKGKVIAYNWIAFSSVQEQEYRIELQPDHAFCLDAYTAPEHRGNGVHYALLRELLAFAAHSRKTKVFTAVSLFNARSWKSHVRMGWKRELTLGYFRPNFTFKRLPWQFTASRYPIRLDWTRHSWTSKSDTGSNNRGELDSAVEASGLIIILDRLRAASRNCDETPRQAPAESFRR